MTKTTREQSGITATFEDKDFDSGQQETSIRKQATFEDKDYD